MDLAMDDVKVKDEPREDCNGAAVGMDDDEEDPVVRKIDVFVKPQLDGTTQLYLLQYPLRPSWRPYNLEERCQAVRIKSQQAKVEVDLEVDVRGDNYDENASEALKIKKQTLSSTHMDLHANYAIGLLKGNQLHLSPLHAAVQLKPSLSYLDAADEAKKKEAAADAAAAEDGDGMEVDEGKAEFMPVQVQIRRRETERQEENRLTSYAYLKQKDESEEWVPLRPYLAASAEAQQVRRKMLAANDQQIAFNQTPEKYIADVTPGRSLAAPSSYHPEDGLESDGLLRSQLESLTLSDRFKLLLSKGPIQVMQFDRLVKMAPPQTAEADLLGVLKSHAMLVQGCWVAGSHLRYRSGPVTSGREAEEKKALPLVRDFFLLLFTRHRHIKRDEIEHLRIPKNMVKEIMAGIATQRAAPPGWDFVEPTDRTFIKKHKEVVEDQVKRWASAEDVIRQMVSELNLVDVSAIEDDDTQLLGPDARALVPVPEPKTEHEANYGLGVNPKELDGPDAKVTPKGTMSQQTRVTLIQVLRDVFSRHGVCSLEFLRESLVEVARGPAAAPGKKMSASEQAKVAAAGQAVAAPPQELALVVSLVARQIGGVYVLTSLGKAEIDPFRNVVIQALMAKPSLRKGDVLEAAKLALKCDVPQAVYTKVLKELCISRGGVWVLRTGDGS